MRTKTLLLTAALAAASITTSMAQVYSVNAVGYVNVSIPIHATRPTTFALAANPLAGTNNNLSTILPSVPDGTQVYVLRGGYEIYTFLGAWLTDTAIAPGEGFFIELPAGSANPTVITFVGEVPQGNLSNPIPVGFSMRSSQVPQAGGVSTALGLVPGDGDEIYTFTRDTQAYEVYTAIGGIWLPTEPNITVGESFFYNNVSGAVNNWNRVFSVN